jgi:predicted nucleic acid-binding protein
MAVYVIDAHAAIELARRRFSGSDDWELIAPTLLRSQVLAILRSEVAAGADPEEALDLAERACRLPRRLLGDAVLRRNAWTIATEQGWSETYDAEYIALTRLHGVALIAGSDSLREKAEAIVPTETVGYLLDAI